MIRSAAACRFDSKSGRLNGSFKGIRNLSFWLVRQVLNKKLLPKGQENFIDYLRWSIEGSGGSTTHVKITAISCEASLGKRDCKVSFSGEFNNGKGEEPEFSFGMRVRLFQGEVMSAQIVDMAG